MLAIFSMMLGDFFDTMGTVIGVGERAGFVDRDGRIPRLNRVLLVDSVGAMVGGYANASTNTTYIESAAGVAEGGPTGSRRWSRACCSCSRCGSRRWPA